MMTFFFGGDDAAIDIAGLGFSNRADSVLQIGGRDGDVHVSFPKQCRRGADSSHSSADESESDAGGCRLAADGSTHGLDRGYILFLLFKIIGVQIIFSMIEGSKLEHTLTNKQCALF
jgi:hypothetical protein